MWTNRKFDNLLELNQWLEEHSLEELFGDTTLPVIVQDEIVEWFYWRKLADNDRFIRYFHRKLFSVEKQFMQYLRIENTNFDPMVSNYIERLINTDSFAKTTGNNNRGSTTTVETEGDNKQTTKEDRQAKHDDTSKVTGNTKDDVTSKTVTDGTNKLVGESSSNNTSSEGSTGSNNSKTSTKEHNTALLGNMPQSSIYGAGMPAELQWDYLSQQNESDSNVTVDLEGSEKRDTSGKSDTKANVNNTDTINSTATTTDSRTGENSSNTVNEGIDVVDGTTQVTGNQTGKSTTTIEDNGEDTSENENLSETKEMAAGRGEAPQDMLNRARDYITRTNSFDWLIAQLEVCFMGIYE